MTEKHTWRLPPPGGRAIRKWPTKLGPEEAEPGPQWLTCEAAYLPPGRKALWKVGRARPRAKSVWLEERNSRILVFDLGLDDHN